MAESFEAKKHAYRQTQDGIVISFVCHPNDVAQALALAPLGTRYMVAVAEIGDNEKPIPERPRTCGEDREASPVGVTAGETAPKARKPFDSLPLSQQAALRCKDEYFQEFIVQTIGAPHPWVACEENATLLLKEFLKINSRAELDQKDSDDCINNAAVKWIDLDTRYQMWMTTQRYKDSRR